MKTEVKAKPAVGVVTPDKNLLLPGEVGLTIEILLSDTKTGKILSHIPERRSESFVQSFLMILRMVMENTHPGMGVELVDTSNVTYTCHNNIYLLDVNGLINIDTNGIVIGTDGTAPAITDYALLAKIAHGVGAGQMQYSAETFAVPVAGATVSQFTVTRNFANGSGGAITVKEVGLISAGKDISQTTRYFLLARDYINAGAGISVPNGQTLTVNYRPQATI